MRTLNISAESGERYIQSEAKEENALPMQRDWVTSRWVFVHFPRCWEWTEADGFIPTLRQIIAKAGANGAKVEGDITPGMAVAIAKGGVVIHPEDRRLGKVHQHYVRRHKIKGGGYHYAFHSESFRRLGKGLAKGNEAAAKPAMLDFRRIIRDRIIEPMDPMVWAEIEDRQQKRVERALVKAKGNSADARVSEAADKLAAMRESWAEYEAEHYGEDIYTGEPIDGGEIDPGLSAAVTKAAPKPRRRRKGSTDE